jgi:hypothetical protein
MAKEQKIWMYAPAKACRVPQSVKDKVTAKANELIEVKLKPENVQPRPKKPKFNYIIDIYSKWYRSFFYLCAKYACPGPHAISPHFELKFARLRYMNNGCFNVAFMRHTNQWCEIYTDMTLEEALEAISNDTLFQP